MPDWDYSIAEIGDQLPSLTLGPIDQADLVLYANASGDQNPIHIDQDFAKKSGLPDVIAHGMLIMSYLGRLLTNAVPQSQIKNFSVQFSNMTHLNQKVICTGKVLEKNSIDNKEVVTVSLKVEDLQGEKKIIGQAIINSGS
jgi:acyl dehydratase